MLLGWIWTISRRRVSTGLADLDTSCLLYIGLSRYLREIDPEDRSRSFHIQNVAIYCRIHFLRNVEQAAGKRDPRGVSARMKALLQCKSKDEYLTLCDLLISKPSPSYR
jgi:hypothetical protein